MFMKRTHACIYSLIFAISVLGLSPYCLVHAAPSHPDVIMLGDSITQAGTWQSLLPNIKVINRGVSGYSTSDLLREIDQNLAMRPEKVFLMIGINDLLRGASVEETYDRYVLIVDALMKNGIDVLIQATLECARLRCGSAVDKVRELNLKLKILAESRNLQFIDLNPDLTSSSQGLLEKFTSDGLHLSKAAYVYWAEKIAPLMQKK